MLIGCGMPLRRAQKHIGQLPPRHQRQPGLDLTLDAPALQATRLSPAEACALFGTVSLSAGEMPTLGRPSLCRVCPPPRRGADRPLRACSACHCRLGRGHAGRPCRRWHDTFRRHGAARRPHLVRRRTRSLRSSPRWPLSTLKCLRTRRTACLRTVTVAWQLSCASRLVLARSGVDFAVVCLARKLDGTWRFRVWLAFCQGSGYYRGLNAITQRSVEPLPHVDPLADKTTLGRAARGSSPSWTVKLRCLVQVGNGIELEAVGFRFEPYRWRPCGVTWDSSRTVVVLKLRRTSALLRWPTCNSRIRQEEDGEGRSFLLGRRSFDRAVIAAHSSVIQSTVDPSTVRDAGRTLPDWASCSHVTARSLPTPFVFPHTFMFTK